MADDPILDGNGTYGEADEFAELTEAAIGDSFGQDFLGTLIFLNFFFDMRNFYFLIIPMWFSFLGDGNAQLPPVDVAAVDEAYLYDQPLPTNGNDGNEEVKPDFSVDLKSEDVPPSSEALSAPTEPLVFPTATPAAPAEPSIDEKLEIDDLMAGKRMTCIFYI